MHKRLLLVSSLALSASLLLGGGVSQAIAKDTAGDASLNPQSGWSVTRIGGGAGTKDGYCALSRQYEKSLVLTLGRNLTDEYSLAVDFQSAELDVDKAYSVTLQPGPGQIRAYEMMPASNQAMVVRLGYDKSFLEALEKSELLKVEINGKEYDFVASDFTSGQTDLNNCWQGLKGGGSTKMASGFSAEKIKDAPPMKAKKIDKEIKVSKVETAKAEIVKAEAPKIEILKVEEKAQIKEVKQEIVKPRVIAAVPDITPIMPVTIVEAPKVKIPEIKAPKVEVAAIKAPIVKAAVPILERPKMKETPETAVMVSKIAPLKSAVKIEPVKIEKEVDKKVEPKVVKAIEISRVSSAVSSSISSGPYEKTKTTHQAIRSNNDALLKRIAESKAGSKAGEAGDKVVSKHVAGKPFSTKIRHPVVKTVDNDAEVKALKAQVNGLKSDLVKEKTKPVPPKVIPEITPKAVPKEPKVAAVDPKVMKKLSDLKSENVRLSSTMKEKDQKITALKTQTPKSKTELVSARAEINELEKENKLLYREAREARGQIDSAVIQAGNVALKKVREYEKKFEAAQSDNVVLLKELEELRLMQEDRSLSAVAGDWDLEQSTKRYNEAEREIKRLGLLLEQQRVAHRQEQTDLEQMLFDPAVTDREQRRRLNELEQQLEQAEKQLGNSGVRSNSRVASISSSPQEERVSVRTFPSLPSAPAPVVEQQRNNLEIQRLNNKIERQNQQLQAYTRNKRTERVSVSSASPARVVTAQPLPAPAVQKSRAPVVRNASVMPSFATPVQRAPPLSFGEGQLKTLLSRSGVPLTGGVIKQSVGRYRWSAGRLVGQAQIVSAASAGNLEAFAQNYIAKARQSCGGDFASLPAALGGQKKAYEIACISPTRSTSSSVIFTQKGSELIAIAHESSADDMDAAMDMRDRVASSL